jgi:hypothetical protein
MFSIEMMTYCFSLNRKFSETKNCQFRDQVQVFKIVDSQVKESKFYEAHQFHVLGWAGSRFLLAFGNIQVEVLALSPKRKKIEE